MRVTIKARTYRGKDGWLVMWQDGGWPQRVWTENRDKADRIKQTVKGYPERQERSTRIDEILREGEGEQ